MTWFFASNQLLLSNLTGLAACTWFLLSTPGFPLFMSKQSPQFCVIIIHSTPRGRAVASNSCWDTEFNFFFPVFSISNSQDDNTALLWSVHLHSTSNYHREADPGLSIRILQIKLNNQCINMEKMGGFLLFYRQTERASDLAWLLQGWCLLHMQEAEGHKQKLPVLLSSLI